MIMAGPHQVPGNVTLLTVAAHSTTMKMRYLFARFGALGPLAAALRTGDDLFSERCVHFLSRIFVRSL